MAKVRQESTPYYVYISENGAETKVGEMNNNHLVSAYAKLCREDGKLIDTPQPADEYDERETAMNVLKEEILKRLKPLSE